MKRDRIIYWITTGLLSIGFLLSSYMYLSKNPELVNGFKLLGIPAYFIALLGTAKLMGALAIVNPWWPTLRQWAYAGYCFTLIGATWIHMATQTPFAGPLIFLVVLAVSFIFHQRLQGNRSNAQRS